MDFKDEFYKNYISNHSVHLYGPITLEDIRNNYSLWDYYYGNILPKEKLDNILEIGCGEGAFISYLRYKGFVNAEGIDISKQQIEFGKTLKINNIHQADISNFLQDKKAKYDFIIARDVLEHFSKQEIYKISKLINRSLRENGRILIQVPNGEGIWYQKIFYGDFTHETLFSVDSARQLFLSSGFSEIQCYPVEFPSKNIKSFLRKLVWKMMCIHHRFRKWIATGNASGIFTPNLLVIARK